MSNNCGAQSPGGLCLSRSFKTHFGITAVCSMSSYVLPHLIHTTTCDSDMVLGENAKAQKNVWLAEIHIAGKGHHWTLDPNLPPLVN